MSTITSGSPYQRPIVAVFDFDGTLTTHHSFWRFLRLVATPEAFYRELYTATPDVLRVLTGLLPLMEGRDKLVMRTVKGARADYVAKLAGEFASEVIPGWIRPDALARLRWHQACGHYTMLVSNSAEDYLVPWGKSVGFDHVAGTRFEVSNGALTGRFDGPSCVGKEKVRRLLDHIGSPLDYTIYAYGDSWGDRELLSAADYRFYRSWIISDQMTMIRKPVTRTVYASRGEIGREYYAS